MACGRADADGIPAATELLRARRYLGREATRYAVLSGGHMVGAKLRQDPDAALLSPPVRIYRPADAGGERADAAVRLRAGICSLSRLAAGQDRAHPADRAAQVHEYSGVHI